MANKSGDDIVLTIYLVVGHIAGPLAAIATFIGAWWYCAATYGFLFGFGLGWLPAWISALIAYAVVRFAWPLLAFGALWVSRH